MSEIWLILFKYQSRTQLKFNSLGGPIVMDVSHGCSDIWIFLGGSRAEIWRCTAWICVNCHLMGLRHRPNEHVLSTTAPDMEPLEMDISVTLTIFGICIGGFWICIEGFRPSNLTMKVLNPGHFKPRDHQGPGGSEAKKARWSESDQGRLPGIEGCLAVVGC